MTVGYFKVTVGYFKVTVGYFKVTVGYFARWWPALHSAASRMGRKECFLPIDLVVTDLRLEGASGIELVAALRGIVADAPVLVMERPTCGGRQR